MQQGGTLMAANQSIAVSSVIVKAQPLSSETHDPKPASLWRRIEAFIDKTFAYAFGDDEKTIRNSVRGL